MKSFTLIKAFLSGTTWLSSGGLKELRRRDRLWILPLAAAGILSAGGAFLYLLINTYKGIYALGQMTGQKELLLFFAFLGSFIPLFLMAIPLGFSLLYFSRDMELLIPMPLKEGEIAGSRIILLWLYLFPVHLFFLVPAMIIQGGEMGITPGIILGGILSLILGPFIPLLFALLLVSLLVRLVDLSRYKTAMEVLGMFFGLFLIVFFQSLLARSLTPLGEIQVEGLLPLLERLMKCFFPFYWMARGITGGLLWLLPGSLFSLGALFLAFFAGGRGFFRYYNRRRVLSSKRGGRKNLKKRGVLLRLFQREWIVLKGHSVFLFEGIGEVFVFPIMLLIFSFTIPRDFLEMGQNFFQKSLFTPLVAWGFLLFTVTVNSISSTSLSREGGAFALSLILPVPGRLQVLGKMVFHLLLFVPVYFLNLVLVFLFLRFSPLHLLYLVPGGIAFIVLSFILTLSVDLARPLLNWTHPMQAMKQNLNTLSGMGLMIAALCLSGGLAFFLSSLGLPVFLTGGILTVLFILLDVFLFPLLLKKGDQVYHGGIEL